MEHAEGSERRVGGQVGFTRHRATAKVGHVVRVVQVKENILYYLEKGRGQRAQTLPMTSIETASGNRFQG